MTKSELVERIARKLGNVSFKNIEESVKVILEQMTKSLEISRRIEIRGFGSFCLHYRKPRQARNPKTGDTVVLNGKHVPHFKPGKEMRERINEHYLSSLNKNSSNN